jgi:hypothetical protein
MGSLVTGLLIDPQLCRIEKVQVSRDRTKWAALLGYETLDRGEFDGHTDLWCADYPNPEWPGFRLKRHIGADYLRGRALVLGAKGQFYVPDNTRWSVEQLEQALIWEYNEGSRAHWAFTSAVAQRPSYS